MSRLKTDELDQFHQFNVYTPARIINLSGEITEELAAEFIKNIKLLDHASDKEIAVLINTEGGDVHQGLAIYDAIKECRSQVITQSVGPTWSMGAVILQAGDKRVVSKNSTIMLHVGKVTLPDEHPEIVAAWAKEFDRVSEVCDKIICDKIKEKHPKFSKRKLKELTIFDRIYTAEETVEMGLADELADYNTTT